MAHPDRMLLAHAPGGIEQPACGLDLDIGAAEFAVMAALDVAAELGRHGHLAVADAEHRHAGIEDRLRRARRAGLMHRFRAAGEDHRLRLHLAESGFGLLERHDFGIDALLAHPARDQLRHLAAEIDDQNLVMRRGHRRRRLCGWLCCCHGQQLRAGGGLATLTEPSWPGLSRPSTPFRAAAKLHAAKRGVRESDCRRSADCDRRQRPITSTRAMRRRARREARLSARLRGMLLQHAHEKPVRAGPARRHQQALRRIAAWRRRNPRPCPTARVMVCCRRHHGEFRMAGDKAADLLAVFRRQHRAGDVGDPAARLDQRGGAVEHRRPGPSAAPRARPGASAIWRRDCGARCRFRCRARRSAPDRRRRGCRSGYRSAPSGCGRRNCARRRATAARRSARAAACRGRWRSAGPCPASSPPAPASCRRRRRRDRSPARRVLRPITSAASCEPSSCTSIAPLMKSSSAWMPGLRASAPSSMRSPIGDHGVGVVPRCASRCQHLLALCLQRVDAQIERRAARHRGRLRDAVVAEHLRQIAVEPFRIIAGDMRPARRRASARSALRARHRSAAPAQNGRRRTSAAMASASRPRSSLSMPSTRARGVSSSMIQALEARRRSTSQIRPEIAARSPEPA